MATKNPLRSVVLLATIAGAGAMFAACSSDTNPTPPTNGDAGSTGGSAGTGGKPSTGGGGGAGTGGKPSTGGSTADGGGTGGTDGGGTDGGGTDGGGTGGSPPADAGACPTGNPAGCSCDPGETLNRCTVNGGNCIKYDNTAHGVPSPLPTLP